MAATALIVDVDGVVSPVHPEAPTWGDEVEAGRVLGPVMVSPTLSRRLEDLDKAPGVHPAWLTSWGAEMSASMDPWPGRDWAAIDPPPSHDRVWWKRHALFGWLAERAQISAVAWCDDDLRAASRRAALRRAFAERNIEVLLVAPRTEVGLTKDDIDVIEEWIASHA